MGDSLATPEVRKFLGAIGTGWRIMSTEKRRAISKANARKSWALRRARYGPNGIKSIPYRPRTPKKAKELVCARCAAMFDHPVWNQS